MADSQAKSRKRGTFLNSVNCPWFSRERPEFRKYPVLATWLANRHFFWGGGGMLSIMRWHAWVEKACACRGTSWFGAPSLRIPAPRSADSPSGSGWEK